MKANLSNLSKQTVYMDKSPLTIFKSFFRKSKPKNTHCECVIDCGAHIYYTRTGIGKVWCPTVKERLKAPFREFPWNQVGVNGQTLTTGKGIW